LLLLGRVAEVLPAGGAQLAPALAPHLAVGFQGDGGVAQAVALGHGEHGARQAPEGDAGDRGGGHGGDGEGKGLSAGHAANGAKNPADAPRRSLAVCAAVPVDTDLSSAVRRGLTARPKRLPAHLFYDREGSQLFEAITELPEYYL